MSLLFRYQYMYELYLTDFVTVSRVQLFIYNVVIVVYRH